MHHVVCDSELNRADLLALGHEPERLSVAPLPPGHRPRPDLRRPRLPGEPVRLLFVGRLAPAKGVHDLVEAVAAARAAAPPFTIDLVGNLAFSDQGTVSWVRERVAEDDLGSVVRLAGQLEDDELAAAYARADALVLPSRHEGFCVPVLEALAAGCAVVTTDAGNLPAIVGGLGWMVPGGDVDALRRTLVEVVTRLSAAGGGGDMTFPSPDGEVPREAWAAAVERHLARYREPAHQRGFLSGLAAALEGAGGDVPGWVREGAA
jgi:glycosyltransferase involved in cell wall biosynthesis